ncbi:MAG: hypothetical protein J6W96_06675, partial [Alphaproteobacteria bacterium]|nr:hypothetical protein [Alphaproteobacteria bacterium]
LASECTQNGLKWTAVAGAISGGQQCGTCGCADGYSADISDEEECKAICGNGISYTADIKVIQVPHTSSPGTGNMDSMYICGKCECSCDTANGWSNTAPSSSTTQYINFSELSGVYNQDFVTPNELHCYKGVCKDEYNYTPTQGDGYTYTEVASYGDLHCYTRTSQTTTQCSDFDQGDTHYVLESACNPAQGWQWTSAGSNFVSDEGQCGTCTPTACPNYTYTSVTGCPNNETTGYPTLKAVSLSTTAGGYTGGQPCYSCVYDCNTGEGYYNQSSTCEAGGHTCNPVTVNNIDGQPVTCYSRVQQPSHCSDFNSGNTHYVLESVCNAGGNKWQWTAAPGKVADEGACGTCQGVCSEGYSNTITQDSDCASYCGAGASYMANVTQSENPVDGEDYLICGMCACGCGTNGSSTEPTTGSEAFIQYTIFTMPDHSENFVNNAEDYCYTATCKTGYYSASSTSDGYTYTEEASYGDLHCYSRVTSACSSFDVGDTHYVLESECTGSGWQWTSAGSDYMSAAGQCGLCEAKPCDPGHSTAKSCGSKGENGWEVIPTGEMSGNEACGTCKEKDCPEYSTYNSVCQVVDGLQGMAGTTVASGGNAYHGEDACYECSYDCMYDDEEMCKQDNGSCHEITSGVGQGCWVSDSGHTVATDDAMTMVNTIRRDVTTSGEEDVEVIRSSDNIENMVDEEFNTTGMINIIHNSTGRAVGIYGEKGNTVTNRQGASINIANNSGGKAIGIYSEAGGTVVNEGDIKITDQNQTGTAMGIYGEGGNKITNEASGVIDVTGQNAYGIYVEDGNGSLVENKGAIYASGSNAHGIYIAESADNSTVLNTGSIYLNGTEKGDAGITLNGGSLRNANLLSFNGDADLNTLGGLVYLEDGGVYEAESLSGDLNVGSSNVLGGNQDVYVSEGALQSDNIDDLNLSSESALFEVSARKNDNGGNDVVAERKNFSEFTPNKSIAEYLEKNYQEGNMEDMYDSVKSETTATKAELNLAKNLGYDILPNFADENYMALKSLNRNISDTMLEPNNDPYRIVAGADHVNLQTKNEKTLSGYDMNASSIYTFGDKRLNNWNRLGLGLSITKLSSSYDRGGDRDLNIFSVFMPYVHNFSDKLRLASVLSVGYGDGDYDRGSRRESDITDIFYGWGNELRYTMDLNGFAELEPALMLNAMGYTEDGFDEDAADGIRSKKTQNMSVEAGIGMFLKKKVSLARYGRLGFRVGGAYYRELADPYDEIQAQRKGSTGWYKMNDYANIYDHDRAVVEAAVDYEYKRFSAYVKYNEMLLKRNRPQMFDLGIKYNF